MNEVVERVAEALWDFHGAEKMFYLDHWEGQALAAIAAMHRPSGKMLLAICRNIELFNGGMNGLGIEALARDAWGEAIEVALADDKPTP